MRDRRPRSTGPTAALLALFLSVWVTPGCGSPAETDARPNLLLVTIDTLRADRLACYGGPPEVGVALCDLFDGGLRYRWAFSTAPYTAPSIASLLTSRYPAYHGVTQSARSYLDAPITTVAEVLVQSGYQTAAFVSNPVLDRKRHLGQGFQVYDQTMTRQERNRPGFAEREAEATTDAVLAWAEVALDEPWFVWVHYQDPHGPYEPPNAVPRADLPGAPRLPVLEVQSGQGGIPAYQALPGIRSLGAYERRYLDEIEYLDPHLIRLIEGLEARARPPAILLTADHGEAFGEDDYYFAHGHSLGLDQIRVPLLYRPPTPLAGPTREIAEPVSLIDLAPTLLALAGAPQPPGYQGRMLPGLAGTPLDAGGRSLYAEHGRRAAIIRDGRYYSRDRQGETDPGVELGQELPWLPPRTQQLREDGRIGPYQSVEAADADRLEGPLSGFLHRTRDRQGVRHEEISNEIQERMRALGYVE